MTPVYTGYYLLTGATGAIGKEIARDLASKGEKLILAVRNMDKANELREELSKAKFGRSYEFLTDEQKVAIRTYYPQKISEAEPRNYGGNK